MNTRDLFVSALGIVLILGSAACAFGSPPEPSSIPSPQATEAPEPPESPVSVSGSMSFASRYLFQGIDYSAGKPVLNPEADLTWGPIGAKLWLNHDLDLRVSNEYDFSLLHEWKAKTLSFTTGYTYLWYPHRDGWTPSQEVYLEASRDGALNPALSVHYDFDAGMGSYSTFGLSHGFERKAGTFTVGTNLFYQDHYYGLSGFPSSEWNVRFEKTLRGATLTPSVSRFVSWANGDFREANAIPSTWLFSFTVARDF